MRASVDGRRGDSPASAGEIFDLVRRGVATTRSALVRYTGLAPSTVSVRVDLLMRHGLLEEGGLDRSDGGRQPRLLRVHASSGYVVAAALGRHHLTVRVADLDGDTVADADIEVDVSRGPGAVIEELWGLAVRLATDAGIDPALLRGCALGLPAPVDVAAGSVSSAQLPGWDHVNIRDILGDVTGVPAIVENDANLLAVAEFQVADESVQHLLAIQAGSRIGCGIITGGTLHQGATGAAGEISHTPINAVSVIPCSCGMANCLESVASGGAIVARMKTAGYSVESITEAVDLARGGDSFVIGLFRESGHEVGEALAQVINFFNPRVVVFGGSMSAAEPYVAAVRATLFDRCLPLVTRVLDVKAGNAGPRAEVQGAVQMMLERILTAGAVDALLSAGE
jgi:predicted NBD/HSP70 family sugar kinase